VHCTLVCISTLCDRAAADNNRAEIIWSYSRLLLDDVTLLCVSDHLHDIASLCSLLLLLWFCGMQKVNMCLWQQTLCYTDYGAVLLQTVCNEGSSCTEAVCIRFCIIFVLCELLWDFGNWFTLNTVTIRWCILCVLILFIKCSAENMDILCLRKNTKHYDWGSLSLKSLYIYI